jgi:hypothetical protein
MFTAELLLFVGTRRREFLDGSRDASLSPNESIKSEKFGLEEFPGRCARCSFRVLPSSSWALFAVGSVIGF